MKILVFIILLVSICFRLTELEKRPMHGDEANQAVRTGLLMEQGVYHYDPADHHGPVLYYAALPFCRATTNVFSETTERNFRIVPVLFSILTLLLVAALYRRDGTGFFRTPLAATFAVLLVALSPAMNYYSRFFIQETMFVTFLTGMLFSAIHYVRAPSSRMRLLCAGGVGGFLGLALATKETVVLSIAAAGGALFIACGFRRVWAAWRTRDALVAAGAAGGVAILLYSSFFTYPQGLYDFLFSTAKTYMTRATEVPEHHHPWNFYLTFLFGWRYGKGPLWREISPWLLLPLMTAVLAPLVGWMRSKRQQADDAPQNIRMRWTLFVAAYTLLLTLLYSCIPYKTPWCILSFLIGYLLLIAKGIEYLFDGLTFFATSRPSRIMSRLAALFLVIACGLAIDNTARHSALACFKYAADIRNPYVYAHTGTDALNLVKAVEEAAQKEAAGQGRYDMPIAIVAPASDYWPLPWYLRKYTRVGYWSTVADIPEGFKPKVLIVSADQGDKAELLMGKESQSNFYGIRPGTLLILFVNEPKKEITHHEHTRFDDPRTLPGGDV